MTKFLIFAALLVASTTARADLRTLGLTATLDGHEGTQFSETLREAAHLPKGELKLKGLECHDGFDTSPGGCSGWLVSAKGDVQQIYIKGQSQVSEHLKNAMASVYKDPVNSLKPAQGDVVMVKEVSCSAHVEECQIVFTTGGGALGAEL